MSGGESGWLAEPDSAVHRALRTELLAARERRAGAEVRVLDVGGGSGAWAVPMAAEGCRVTVVDASPNALAALGGRVREAGVEDLVSAVQGDVQTLTDVVGESAADLVLCHGLLEVVDDVGAAVAQLAAATVPGGAVSALVAGRHAAALAQAHAGRLAQARAVLADPAGRSGPHDPLQRRLSMAALQGLLESAAGLSVELVQGDGVFEGWLPAAVLESDPGGPDGLEELESIVAATPELLVLAARLHVIARRPGALG
ncbi:class I SAM-dependent methyltransferase [Pseudonocardia spinosispora]|uniref:class I SAM-dependent methyltransferase n=1 Tax=Pseudonocardia spinosispora TaxID=103441 RepID=UPI000412A46D|nr:class I SAM-dependent methyltransferase [Pseudonocardia spinosispora]